GGQRRGGEQDAGTRSQLLDCALLQIKGTQCGVVAQLRKDAGGHAPATTAEMVVGPMSLSSDRGSQAGHAAPSPLPTRAPVGGGRAQTETTLVAIHNLEAS